MRAGKKLLVTLGLLGLFCGQVGHTQQLLWSFLTPEPAVASPCLAADGTVYFGSYDRAIYALKPGGTNVWRSVLPPPTYVHSVYTGVYGTPALGTDGSLYVPCENGLLVSFNVQTGLPSWQYATADAIYSSPAIAIDGTVYSPSYDKRLYALRPDGTRKWSTTFASSIFASPAVAQDGTVYCGSDAGTIYALRPDDGTVKWTFNTGDRAIVASPAVGADGTVYIGVGSYRNPTFYSISSAGLTNWMFTVGKAIRSSAALDTNGTVYFGCDDGFLYALNSDGTVRWTFNAGSPIGSSPALADDGTVYFGADNGKLCAVDANGQFRWDFQTLDKAFGSPAIGPDGTVYITSNDGSLYAVRGQRPPMASAWPMFRHDPYRTGRASESITNSRPVLSPVADQTLCLGETLSITNEVSDADLPAQNIHFSLASGAPALASVDPATGVFTWTPSAEQLPSTNVVGIVATDDGSPQLSDIAWFTVCVVSNRPPYISVALQQGMVTLSWKAIPRRIYRAQFKNDLWDAEWNDIPGDIVSESDLGSAVAPADAEQRFYRVVLVEQP